MTTVVTSYYGLRFYNTWQVTRIGATEADIASAKNPIYIFEKEPLVTLGQEHVMYGTRHESSNLDTVSLRTLMLILRSRCTCSPTSP
jgi:hypothetical protein